MPSVIVVEAMASEASKDLKKTKGKKTPKPAAETLDSEKKKSKHSKVDSESDPEGSLVEKKEKKRNAVEIDSGDEQGSETSSELVEPVNFKAEKKKNAKLMEAVGSDEEEDPNAITNFRISKPLREALKAKELSRCLRFKL